MTINVSDGKESNARQISVPFDTGIIFTRLCSDSPNVKFVAAEKTISCIIQRSFLLFDVENHSICTFQCSYKTKRSQKLGRVDVTKHIVSMNESTYIDWLRNDIYCTCCSVARFCVFSHQILSIKYNCMIYFFNNQKDFPNDSSIKKADRTIKNN